MRKPDTKNVCISLGKDWYNFCTSHPLYPHARGAVFSTRVKIVAFAPILQKVSAVACTAKNKVSYLLKKLYAPFTQGLLPTITKYLNNILISPMRNFSIKPGGIAL